MLVLTTILAVTLTFGTVLTSPNSASAVTKLCNFTTLCAGTNGGDSMGGDAQKNIIDGCGGDDVISGSLGDDVLAGDGIDPLCGFPAKLGADKINGGPGDDRISHGNAFFILSDGHRDFIDCGPGNDEAWINVNVDNDVAKNCEQVHVG